MIEPNFQPAERQSLMRWFEGHPVSRLWVSFPSVDTLQISGFLANSDVGPLDLGLSLSGKLLPDVMSHEWHGLDDPDHDPEPEAFRVFRWWPKIEGVGFSVLIPFGVIRAAATRAEFAKLEIVDRRTGRPAVDTSQALYTLTH